MSLTLCVCHPPFIWSSQQPDLSHELGKAVSSLPSPPPLGYLGVRRALWGLPPARSHFGGGAHLRGLTADCQPTTSHTRPFPPPCLPSPSPWGQGNPRPYMQGGLPHRAVAQRTVLVSYSGCLTPPSQAEPTLSKPISQNLWPSSACCPRLDLTTSLRAGLPSLPHPTPPPLPVGAPSLALNSLIHPAISRLCGHAQF